MKLLNLFTNLLLKKNIILNIILEILFAVISLTVFEKFFKVQITKKHKSLYFVTNALCIIFTKLLTTSFISYTLSTIISIILLIHLFKISKLKTFVYFCIQSILLLNIHFLIYSLPNIFALQSYRQIATLPIFNMLSLTLASILGIILYFCFRKIDFDNLGITTIKKTSILLSIIALLNFTVAQIIMTLFMETLTQTILYIVALDMYFYMSTLTIIHICSTLYSKTQIHNLTLCNKTILAMCDDARAFKHDFHNIMQALGGYIITNDMKGLKKYYTDLTADCINSNNFYKLTPDIINNPAIYNLLVDKYNLANNNDININLDVMLDLNKLNMKTYELTRILGILLDNAIEASKECNEKNIKISFTEDKYKQMLLVENTYKDKQISIDKMFEKDFSTKPHNTGLGLWEVRRILSRRTNLNLHTTKNNDYFSQQLEIYTV